MKQDYIVLKDFSKNEGTILVARGDDADVTSEVSNLSEEEFSNLRQESEYVAGAPVMPICLIEPMGGDKEDCHLQPGVSWGVQAVGADNSSFTGEGVTVAVLDTGIDETHPAFEGMEIIQEDFTDTKGTANENVDTNGHGTHCAGTIFGKEINGYRYSVAPGVNKALIGKVIGKGSSTATIITSIEWALDNGADVISMSLGIDYPNTVKNLQKSGYPPEVATSVALSNYVETVSLFSTLGDYLEQKHKYRKRPYMLIAATGNQSRMLINSEYRVTATPPSASNGFISVGAVGRTDTSKIEDLKVAHFSNSNPHLVGPGVDICSAKPGGKFVESNGTSMATPHVAGVAALWLQKLDNSPSGVHRDEWVSSVLGSVGKEKLIADQAYIDIGRGLIKAP